MKTVKRILGLLLLAIISLSFSQCASTMELQKKAPTTFGETYTQNWVAGVKGGGSGTNIFININDESIALDSVFFKGKATKLKTKPANKKLFIGRFKSNSNTAQSGLKEADATKKETAIPFELKDDECVVSYVVDGETKYYKLTGIKEKPLEALPMSAPPNRN